MAKRQRTKFLEELLLRDEQLTKQLVAQFLKYPSFKSIKTHCKSLEVTCNGIVWLCVWIAFIWMFSNNDLYEMQLNMLFGLILDIIIIALLKATCRRRRPIVPKDMLVIGPDKFSFPSGHASRSTFVLLFFTILSPISKIWWLPLSAWCICVCLSRLIIQRHYILDVVAGIVTGSIEASLLYFLWIGKSTATDIINYVSNDYLPGDTE